MLTATYTLVALSVEQSSIRASLKSFQKLVQSSFRQSGELGTGQLNYAYDVMRRAYEACHWRKVDMFLVPAIREASADAGQLLLELDTLKLSAGGALGVLALSPRNAPVDDPARVSELCDTFDCFCQALLGRIEREEKSLFPLARGAVSGEAWFAIANQMLVFDDQQHEDRLAREALAAMPTSAAPARPTHIAAH
ncbi:MAG: hypothetical protein V4463_02610 [Pseudomonadota bacterium]